MLGFWNFPITGAQIRFRSPLFIEGGFPMSSRIVKITLEVKAPARQVYEAFTNATLMRGWFSDVASVDAQYGKRLYLYWNSGYDVCGEYTSLEKDKSICFTWKGRGEPGTSQVKISLKPRRNKTILTLTHRVPSASQKWQKALAGFKEEWPNVLGNLVSVLETGQDLRITRRPMLGIFFGDFNPAIAEKLCVPVQEGIRLEGIVDGMGAQTAGLQKDDVIVCIDEKIIATYLDLGNVIQPHHAGDKIAVTYYRGSEKRSTTMILSPRVLPEIHTRAGDLVEALRRLYAEIDSELVKCFGGATEEQASHSPAPGEWSAKEVLAHLIHGERDTHGWINDMVSYQERVSDGYADNYPGRIKATVGVYQTYQELLKELSRNEAETVAMLAALPEDFLARKGSFWRLSYVLINSPQHAQAHYSQIRSAIAST